MHCHIDISKMASLSVKRSINAENSLLFNKYASVTFMNTHAYIVEIYHPLQFV